MNLNIFCDWPKENLNNEEMYNFINDLQNRNLVLKQENLILKKMIFCMNIDKIHSKQNTIDNNLVIIENSELEKIINNIYKKKKLPIRSLLMTLFFKKPPNIFIPQKATNIYKNITASIFTKMPSQFFITIYNNVTGYENLVL